MLTAEGAFVALTVGLESAVIVGQPPVFELSPLGQAQAEAESGVGVERELHPNNCHKEANADLT